MIEQPATGFHVASVHSICVSAIRHPLLEKLSSHPTGICVLQKPGIFQPFGLAVAPSTMSKIGTQIIWRFQGPSFPTCPIAVAEVRRLRALPDPRRSFTLIRFGPMLPSIYCNILRDFRKPSSNVNLKKYYDCLNIFIFKPRRRDRRISFKSLETIFLCWFNISSNNGYEQRNRRGDSRNRSCIFKHGIKHLITKVNH